MDSKLSFRRIVRTASLATMVAALGVAAPVVAAAKPKVQVTTEADAAGYRLRTSALGAFTPPTLDVSRFAFTAPGRTAPARVATVERSFRFTPSGSADRRALALGVTSRVLTASASPGPAAAARAIAAAPADLAFAPAGYNVDLSVAWMGFALTGGMSRLDQALGRRDGVDVGLGYRASRWRAALQASAERGGPVLIDPAKPEARYSFEASGAYLLSPGVSVNGGVRYRMSPLNPTLLDPSGEDRAVYVGGSLAF